MRKRNLALSFAAGLLGGVLGHYITAIPSVHAESIASVKELRSERFVLINSAGSVLGSLAYEGDRPELRLFDTHGNEIWSAGGRTGLQRGSVGK